MKEQVSLTTIHRGEVLRYLRLSGALLSEETTRLLDESERLMLAAMQPAYCYEVYAITGRAEAVNDGESEPYATTKAERAKAVNDGESEPYATTKAARAKAVLTGGRPAEIALEGCALTLSGEDMKRLLAPCTHVALLAATLSSQVDALLRRVQLQDMTQALFCDCMANVAIEQVCDKAEERMQAEWVDYRRTFRFGVGYGDFPLSIQPHFLQTLQAQKQLGLCCTERFLLTPLKSITAVIGLIPAGNAEETE